VALKRAVLGLAHRSHVNFLHVQGQIVRLLLHSVYVLPNSVHTEMMTFWSASISDKYFNQKPQTVLNIYAVCWNCNSAGILVDLGSGDAVYVGGDSANVLRHP